MRGQAEAVFFQRNCYGEEVVHPVAQHVKILFQELDSVGAVDFFLERRIIQTCTPLWKIQFAALRIVHHAENKGDIDKSSCYALIDSYQ